MNQTNLIIDFYENERGRRGQREYARETFPAETGYLRAYYIRSNGSEWCRYSPEPQSERYVYIDLRGAPREDLAMMLTQAVSLGDVTTVKTLLARGVRDEVRRRTGGGLIRYAPKRNKMR